MKVGVFPIAGFRQRRRLFGALERVFPLQFQGRSDGEWRDLDAAVVFATDPESSAVPEGVPCLVALSGNVSGSRQSLRVVSFTSASQLDSRLRGQIIHESVTGEVRPMVEGRVVLASLDGTPLWQVGPGEETVELVVTAPPELGEAESLRDLMRSGRFLALLPLIHFLRRVSGYETWHRQELGAAFIFDDPNLHWPTYGHLGYREIAAHATRSGYHVAMATIPLDSWFTNSRAARVFRESAAVLSLAAHGNDHLYHELAVPRSADQAVALFKQAAMRLERLEQAAGVRVSRVMVPPHGVCDEELLEPMLRAGFIAFCNGGRWWHDWHCNQRSIAGWNPTTVSSAGIPIMSRHEFRNRFVRDEALLDAFLDKPVLLYGHHSDVADGYDVLAETANWLKSLGSVRWRPLTSLVESTVLTKTESSGSLRVRSYSRRFLVDVPAGCERLVVELPFKANENTLVYSGNERALEPGGSSLTESRSEFEVREGERVNIRVVRHSGGECVSGALRTSGRAYVRRSVGETRDRLHPLLRRMRLVDLLRQGEVRYDTVMRKRLQRRAGAASSTDHG